MNAKREERERVNQPVLMRRMNCMHKSMAMSIRHSSNWGRARSPLSTMNRCRAGALEPRADRRGAYDESRYNSVLCLCAQVLHFVARHKGNNYVDVPLVVVHRLRLGYSHFSARHRGMDEEVRARASERISVFCAPGE